MSEPTSIYETCVFFIINVKLWRQFVTKWNDNNKNEKQIAYNHTQHHEYVDFCIKGSDTTPHSRFVNACLSFCLFVIISWIYTFVLPLIVLKTIFYFSVSSTELPIEGNIWYIFLIVKLFLLVQLNCTLLFCIHALDLCLPFFSICCRYYLFS